MVINLETGFYVTGGTLRRDAPSYVERQADRDLLAALRQGEYCYVLNARQMGKSSLCVRTMGRLREEGIRTVFLDLQKFGGRNLTAEQWYAALLSELGRELGLRPQALQYWKEHPELPPVQRLFGAIREVALPQADARRLTLNAQRREDESEVSEVERRASSVERLAIFIDEIDVTRSLPFNTDEFFAAIRQCYTGRATEPALRQVTFCLLGTATPAELIEDTRISPFNIGRRIEVRDFTLEEAAPLVRGLAGEGESKALLARILYWTGGHPYLTQRLCRAVAEAQSVTPSPFHPFTPSAAVDRLCEALFLTHTAREGDDNLSLVRNRLLKSDADLASLLELYGKVQAGKRVRPDDTNPLIDLLRLSGIARLSGERLVARNRIYARVFDRGWVKANMPDAELRRQRSAFRKGLLRSAAVACAVVGVVGALALSAVSQRDRARRLLYVADMNVAQQALSEGNQERAEELLDEHRPRTVGGADLRGFEWRHLWRLCQEDALHTFHEDAGAVWGVAYSPDGRTLAAVNEDGTVKLWDVVTKGLVATLPTSLEHKSKGVSVAFSPDGRMLAASSYSTGLDCVVTLWDVAGATRGRAARGTAQRRGAGVLAAERTAAGEQGRSDAGGRGASEPARELATFSPSPNGSLTFSPDGKFLAAAGWSGTGALNGHGTLKLWDVTTKQGVVTFQSPRPLWSAAFSPDGKTLATMDGYKAVALWDVAAKRRVALLPTTPKDWLQAVAFSPDGETLATCGDDQTVRLWDRATWRVLATLPKERPPSMGSRRLVPSGGSWSSMAFSPNGKKLATANGAAREVTLWDLDTRKQIAAMRGHKEGVSSLKFSPDGETLATGSADGTVKLWSATPTGQGAALGKLRSDVLSVAFAPDSKTLAMGNADGTVTLWSAASGPELTALKGHSGPIRSVAFSRNGRVLASGGSDRTVRLWDVASHRQLATLTGHKDHVWCVAFSPGGKTLASGGEDGAVKLWDIASATSGTSENAREIITLRTGAGVVMALSFSPDGKILALGTNENSVKLWDIVSRQEVAALLAHTSSVTATAFSPDGKTLATGSLDHTVVLWDVAARQPRAVLKGCKERIDSVAFSPDGKTLASGSSEASVRLWNVSTGREVGTLRGPQGAVSWVAFSPDGSTLAAGGKDRSVGVWRAASFAETDAQQSSAELTPPR